MSDLLRRTHFSAFLLLLALAVVVSPGIASHVENNLQYTNSTMSSHFTRSLSDNNTLTETATARPFWTFDNFTIFVLGLIATIGTPVVFGVFRAARKSGRAAGPSWLASFVAFVAVVCLVIIVAGPLSQIIIPSIRGLPTASIEVSVAASILIIICVGLLALFFGRSQQTMQKKRLEIRLLDCSHYRNAEKQSILEVDFELSNPSSYQTSVKDIGAWILDGTYKLEGQLQSLWDYRTLARIKESYDPEKRPDFEKLQLPHLLAEPTERYVAIFRFTDTITSGVDTKCGILVIHTHGEEPCEGISHPTPLQRIAGRGRVTEETSEDLRILLNENTFLLPPIIRFDFELRAGKEPIGALEIQVGHGHSGSPTEWVNLDLRQYDFQEVEKGKVGEPIKRISLLGHDIQRITFVTFYVVTPTEIRFTMRTFDPNKQRNYTKLLWATPFFEVYARFVGLTKEVQKRYVVVYNKPPWGVDTKTGWSNPHVELVEADSTRGKELLAEWERIRKELNERGNTRH
jgi:hypothetical protein